MALRRLAGNKNLISGNIFRSLSGVPFSSRSSNQIPPPVSHPTFFSNVFDPLAQPTRSMSQLMNQSMGNNFSAHRIIGAGGTSSVISNLCKIDGMKTDTKRSFSSAAETADQPKIVRPLSPHLPIYKPQTNSLGSIFNRISGAYLAGVISLSYLMCLKLGPVCFTHYDFYQLFFYSSKLSLFSAELAAVALAYHILHSLPHVISDLSALLFLKRLGGKSK